MNKCSKRIIRNKAVIVWLIYTTRINKLFYSNVSTIMKTRWYVYPFFDFALRKHNWSIFYWSFAQSWKMEPGVDKRDASLIFTVSKWPNEMKNDFILEAKFELVSLLLHLTSLNLLVTVLMRSFPKFLRVGIF